MNTTERREGESRPMSFAFWDRKIGPFLDEGGVLNVAALSADELRVCEEFGDILVLPTAGDRDALYPAFQFGPRGELLPGLREIVASLRPSATDDWDIALWLATVRKKYHGRCAVDLMWAGRAQEVVLSAKADSALWTAGVSQ